MSRELKWKKSSLSRQITFHRLHHLCNRNPINHSATTGTTSPRISPRMTRIAS